VRHINFIILLLVFLFLGKISLTQAVLPLNSFDSSWQAALGTEFNKNYFKELDKALTEARKTKLIYPSEEQTFTAFKLTPLSQLKVVIIGQDPYPGEETDDNGNLQPLGHGLAFSVRPEIKQIPKSLYNIFVKLNQELGLAIPEQGNLNKWATQGVLLMNATLTLDASLPPAKRPNSHKSFPSNRANWRIFTDAVIDRIAASKKNVVFILWGSFAQNKERIISKYLINNHLVIKGAHPSPMPSSLRLFMDPSAQFFKPTNEFLIKTNQKPINWDLTK